MENLVLVEANDIVNLKYIKDLFLEYARSLEFNLCFQDFEKELAELPGEYSFPSGSLLLLMIDNQSAGCVALRKIDNSACEMKRLYVRQEFRGRGFGRKLALAIINKAMDLGYSTMKLDTVPSMKQAIQLYKDFGFKEISAYRYNPVGGAIYMELDLTHFKS